MSVINDDVQMAYMNLKDYVELCQVDQMHTQQENIRMSTSFLDKRNSNDKDFEYGKGITMNWKLVPVENQKPQINWKQDINSPDSETGGTLASYQPNNGLGGTAKDPGFTVQAGKAADWMGKHYDAIKKELAKTEGQA